MKKKLVSILLGIAVTAIGGATMSACFTVGSNNDGGGRHLIRKSTNSITPTRLKTAVSL